jgi:hypothetical protein
MICIERPSRASNAQGFRAPSNEADRAVYRRHAIVSENDLNDSGERLGAMLHLCSHRPKNRPWTAPSSAAFR